MSAENTAYRLATGYKRHFRINWNLKFLLCNLFALLEFYTIYIKVKFYKSFSSFGT